MNFILLFGGNSFEHEISVVSAITLRKELNFGAHFVFVDSDSNLFLIPQEKMNSKHFSSHEYKNDARLEFAKGGFCKKKLLGSELLSGIVVNLIHGKSGEDGQIAAILDFYDIPFIGPRLEASAISFNKELTKFFARARGVKTLEYEVIKKGQDFSEIERIVRKIGQKTNAIIIKPARLGSSIGISIIKNFEDTREIQYALDVGFELDCDLILEPFIAGIEEYNLAGCAIGGEFRHSKLERVKKDEFLDFDKKYLDFSARKKPENAQIDESLRLKIAQAFNKIYRNCFEGALVRCDFFVIENEVYLNEINPIPGSMAYYLFSDFLDVISALTRHLPPKNTLQIKYQYISKIQAQKGK